MTVKKAPPKKRAVKKKAPVRKKAPNKVNANAGKTTKPPIKKKIAPKKKAVAVPKNTRKKVPVKQSKRVARVPGKAKPKLRARQRKLGPIPKYHIDHQSWDKAAVMGIICKELMRSSKGIAYICRDDDDLPCISSVNQWFSDENAEGGEKPLLDMYARAKELQIDFLADETIEIGDNECSEPVCIDGVPVTVNGELIQVTTSATVQKSKLRCDNRRWIAERLAHRKYGNKLELSSDPERPLSTQSDDEIEARILLLQKKQAANGLNES